MFELHIGHISDRSQQWCFGRAIADSNRPGFTKGAYIRAAKKAAEMNSHYDELIPCALCGDREPRWEAIIWCTTSGEVMRHGSWGW